MKILFLLGAASRIRNFEHTIRLLAERGHTLTLAGRPRKGKLELPKTLHVNGVSIRENPTVRGDDWGTIAETLRGARDYVRYLDPRFASATRLVRRAYEISPTGFVLFCERHPGLKRRWKWLSSLLAIAEDLIPSAASFEAFVREERPDLILVTPLVTFESYQTDYVKAAHRLGIPIVFLPFSWDNLTNKGLMRILPDRVLVWNEVQKTEAIELHGVPAARVAAVGAARFDEFFAKSPSTARQEFFVQYGLDPATPLVLYLGSSQLTGPNEMELVRRYLEALRSSEDPVLRSCAVLVRPHPALKTSWQSVDLSEFPNVGVCLHARRSADQELFDSLWHAHVAVGLNTSAMLEAAIVGRPVQTLLIPGFDEGQIGTIHFSYLVEAFGGVVTVAHSFAEHHEQLVGILSAPPAPTARSRAFAEQFLRPHGIDRPVYPILADAIELAGTLRKRPRRMAPPWHPPLRWALKAWMRRRATTAGDGPVVDETPVGTSMSLRPVRTALEELRQDNGPIFVGPWLDDAGSEWLFWIPFVRWAARTYGLSAERLIVVSRSGVRAWYGPLAGRYLDARELFRGTEFDEGLRRTIPQCQQNPKQAVMYPFDQDVLLRAAAVMDAPDHQVLHPQMFFRILQRLHGDRALARLREVLIHERPQGPTDSGPREPPARFVAMSRTLTGQLPETPAHRALIDDLVQRVAEAHDVVIVDGPAAVPGDRRVHTISAPDLATQVATLRRAEAFVGPYGALPLLAVAHGVPAYAFHAEPLPLGHRELVDALAREGVCAPLTIQPVDTWRAFQLPVSVSA